MIAKADWHGDANVQNTNIEIWFSLTLRSQILLTSINNMLTCVPDC